MAVGDDQIGRNVARLRGALSQKGLADKMRERGWRWTQGTVSEIEAGIRPVRLNEAEDLAEIFNLGPMGVVDLTGTENSAALRQALHEITRVRLSLDDDASQYLTAQVNLAEVADIAELSETEAENVRDWLQSSPEERVSRMRRLRAQLIESSGGADIVGQAGSFLELLNREWARYGEHPKAPER